MLRRLEGGAGIGSPSRRTTHGPSGWPRIATGCPEARSSVGGSAGAKGRETTMTRPRSRILVVDDDPDIRDLLSDRLRLMQLEVTCAADGQEALALLRQEAPPLTLLDLQLPRLNGME